MIKSLQFSFPDQTQEAQNFFQAFTFLFKGLKNAHCDAQKLTVSPDYPSFAYPETTFVQTDEAFPSCKFTGDSDVSFLNEILRKVFLVAGNTAENKPIVTIEQLVSKIKGHVIAVDHTGINLPSISFPKTEWEKLVNEVASQSAIYNYPNEENWLFIIPCTSEEFKTDITTFQVGREPKFEFVYDHYAQKPLFQFDLHTNFTRAEIIELFPDPIGMSYEGLANFFRSIPIRSPWSEVDLRFDLRFKGSEQENDWETGKWLITEGKRIIARSK